MARLTVPNAIMNDLMVVLNDKEHFENILTASGRGRRHKIFSCAAAFVIQEYIKAQHQELHENTSISICPSETELVFQEKPSGAPGSLTYLRTAGLLASRRLFHPQTPCHSHCNEEIKRLTFLLNEVFVEGINFSLLHFDTTLSTQARQRVLTMESGVEDIVDHDVSDIQLNNKYMAK